MDGAESMKEKKGKSMKPFEKKTEESKPDILDELLALLKRLLNCFLRCVMCGCYHGDESDRMTVEHDNSGEILLDSEKQAVKSLLLYLENVETKNFVLKGDQIRALNVLTYSDNVELQRSAALCFSEISQKMKCPMTHGMARPLIDLLKSRDTQVQKAATLAVCSFALSRPDKNKDLMLRCDAFPALLKLLNSESVEVQSNTCACIITLATKDQLKTFIVTENGFNPLLNLLMSHDLRVQCNAAGAILNLTHLESNRNAIVNRGAIPVLVEALHSPDGDVQYHCLASLCNIALNKKYRTMMTAVGHHDVLKRLIRLISSESEKVKCQACIALRNLAADDDNQCFIAQYGGVPTLHQALKSNNPETKIAVMGCIRNLSLHKMNESILVQSDILSDIGALLCDHRNPEAQKHAAGTIRNLAIGENLKVIAETQCVKKLAALVLSRETKMDVLAEVTAALAVLADQDEVKYWLVQISDGQLFIKLVTLASLSSHTEVRYNSAGILGQISLIVIPTRVKLESLQGIVLYIDTFLKSSDPSFVHIALWTLVQHLKDEVFLKAFRDHSIESVISHIVESHDGYAIGELVQCVMKYLQVEESDSGCD
ncbi:hypothetical protein ACJMK2_004438 [Sinanodonta woodiana]|uniref:Vacuolar protein 8 n=1 Tax=Sinanodonta woodiana TaxID=1069815 RepID=A0ABD3Y161_SINWO